MMKLTIDGINNEYKGVYGRLSIYKKILIWIIINIKSDYFTFFLGIISAVLTEELLGFFKLKICDNIPKFLINLFALILCILITILLLNFTVKFTKIQDEIYNHKSEKTRINALFDNYIVRSENNFIELSQKIKQIFVLTILLIIEMICQFLLININIIVLS